MRSVRGRTATGPVVVVRRMCSGVIGRSAKDFSDYLGE